MKSVQFIMGCQNQIQIKAQYQILIHFDEIDWISFHFLIKYICPILSKIGYGKCPKSECSDFGNFRFGSVVESFGFRTFSLIHSV